jgi:hypothetical protein
MVSDDDIKVEMMSPPWKKFLWFLLRFIVVRYDHDEGLGSDRKKKEDTRKKKFLNSVCRNVGRRSLDIRS